MRLKILFFPLILVASISILISFVWPEVSNIRQIASKNKEAEEMLALIREKKNIIRSLDQDLGKNSDKEKLVKEYLSVNKNEEKAINSISYLATASSVSLANVAIEENSQKAMEVAPVMEDAMSGDMLFESEITGLEQVDVPVDLKNTVFNITILGKYENIKAFLSGMTRMGLMNNIKDVRISLQSPEVGEEGEIQSKEILSAEISSEFYYIENMHIKGNVGLKVLNAPNFDFSQVDNIKQFISQGAATLESGEKGNRNPFLAF